MFQSYRYIYLEESHSNLKLVVLFFPKDVFQITDVVLATEACIYSFRNGFRLLLLLVLPVGRWICAILSYPPHGSNEVSGPFQPPPFIMTSSFISHFVATFKIAMIWHFFILHVVEQSFVLLHDTYLNNRHAHNAGICWRDIGVSVSIFNF